MNIRKLLPTLLAIYALLGLSQVEARPTKAPLRFRLNSKLIKTIFVKDD